MDQLISHFGPGGGLVALIAAAVLAVIRGWLVPKRTVDQLAEATARVEAVQAQRLADSVARESEWKAAWQAADEARRVQAEQLRELLELGRTMDAFIRSLRSVTGGTS